MQTLIANGKVAMQDPNNYEARANLMWSGTMAHNNILGVGREQDWSSHHRFTNSTRIMEVPSIRFYKEAVWHSEKSHAS